MAHELPQIIFMSREYNRSIHDNLRDYLWQFLLKNKTRKTSDLKVLRPLRLRETKHTPLERTVYLISRDRMRDYSKSVMALEGMSSLEKANIFLPRSFSEAPI